jgi:hypothetical protein
VSGINAFCAELIWPTTDLKRIEQIKSMGYILIAGRLIVIMDLFVICITIRKIWITIYINVKKISAGLMLGAG